ncbi:MAG: asparaginase [Candidatus Cyclobacteriaceae bacterium M2_1C_046]
MNILPIVEINTASPDMPASSVLIIYTGGTLGMVEDEFGALVPLDFAHILEHIPSLKTLKLRINVIAFETPIDSSDVRPEHWVQIAEIISEYYDSFDGFVVLHGTDTMAYSASALSFMLDGLNKPVIFTGAQLPITAPRSDGRENLITSIEIAVAKEKGEPVIPEVAIFFDYLLLRGNRARKVESMFFDAFESENFPPLAEAGITITYRRDVINNLDDRKLFIRKNLNNKVGVLRVFPGMSSDFVKAVITTPGLRGLIIETFGSGNAPTEEWFYKLLEEAIKKDIIILNVSQCTGGRVLQGKYHTSQKLKDIGILSGKDITTEAALTKMMLLLGEFDEVEKVKELLILPLSGEMSDVDVI